MFIENDHYVTRLMKFLPAGPTEDGGNRSHDLVQFVAKHGGIRTVKAEDIYI